MKEIFMVGNTHFDPVWLWKWDEALSSITATFRSALERMKETPDFCYSFSAPAVLEQIEETDPALFAEIKARIDEGRWDLAEGWWLQADTNAAMGESLVRQGLYAQLYLEEKFGKRSLAAFNIDSFGHCSNLPQILSGCGMKYYAFWRPNEEQFHLPSPLFRWNGAADSSVLAYRVGGEGGDIFTEHFEEETMEPVVNSQADCDLMVVFGVTDHGGAPTKAEIKTIEAYREKEKERLSIRFGTVEEYFALQEGKTLPEINGEIPVTFIGPYSNFTEIKKNNRRAEYSALNAEKVAVLRKRLLGTEYPRDTLTRAWKDILFNQFHDILGGCCIEDAYFDARNLHGRTIQNTDEIVTYGLQAITNQIHMPGKNPDNAWNLVIWNLNGSDFDSVLEAEAQWAWEFPWYGGGIELVDEEGNTYPCQIIREKSVVPRFRSRFAFRVKIPAMGYRSFIVKQTDTPYTHKVPEKATCVKNERYCLSAEKGTVTLWENGEVVSTSFIRPYVLGDICDTWGFNKTVYEAEKQYLTLESAEITEEGPILNKMKTVWRYNHSKVEIYYTLTDSHIDCSYRANWQEEGCALKLELAPVGKQVSCCASGPYSVDQRSEMEYERPMGEYLSLVSDQKEFHMVTDSIFAYRFENCAAGLTVLRNCIFGDLRTEPLADADYRFMGQGITDGNVRIFTEQRENLASDAAAHNNAPRILLEANHPGRLESHQIFYCCSNPEIVMTTLKQQEKGEENVLRLFNPTEQEQKAEISVFGTKTTVALKPFEICTLKEERGKWRICNMLEE